MVRIAVQALLEDHPEMAALSLDAMNAFNMLERSAIEAALRANPYPSTPCSLTSRCSRRTGTMSLVLRHQQHGWQASQHTHVAAWRQAGRSAQHGILLHHSCADVGGTPPGSRGWSLAGLCR